MSGYPVQFAKVQPPPLREETLARHRLLDWLAKKVHHRIVLILADAGYGKTTLLADFATRTRLRTLWYRMDEDDRDWMSLLAHLVAAGREADPGFAPNTAAMLADTSLSGPPRDTVIGVFARELQTIAPQGAVLIIDDFHLVDEAPDARLVARELVANAPERLTIVFSSRRMPVIPIAKLRSTGEVAELTTDDLRFDARETEQLFRDTYHRTLDPDVLADVTERTEGWAASLQLVHAALRDRTPAEIRRFVRGLSGADHELYDYLAEEVVGDLPDDVQRFLMRTSILQMVTPAFAEVVTGAGGAEVARLTAVAERVTLLGRRARGPRSELRYHPLVREFLEARMARDDGSDAVRDLHRAVAAFAAERDWRIAAHHLWSAGDHAEAFDLIDSVAKGIIGRGEYLIAAPFLADVPEGDMRASFEVILSRRDFKDGDVRRALERAERAVNLEPSSDVALANLSSIYVNNGIFDLGIEAARRLLAISSDAGLRGIAAGILSIVDAAVDGDVAQLIDDLRALGSQQSSTGDVHYEGITHLNLADAYRVAGNHHTAIDEARSAIDLLRGTAAGAELATARAILAWNLAHEGRLSEARAEIGAAQSEWSNSTRLDVLFEAADIEAVYGSAPLAEDHLAALQGNGELRGYKSAVGVLRATLLLRQGRPEDALTAIRTIDLESPSTLLGNKARAMAVEAHALAASKDEDADRFIALAISQAERQSAGLTRAYGDAILAVNGAREQFSAFVRRRSQETRWTVTRVAEQVCQRLHELDTEGLQVVRAESVDRPERWRPALRSAIDGSGPSALTSAWLLDVIGEAEDVVRLRALARSQRGRPESELGRSLARRLALPVLVEDLGRVAIRIGGRRVEGSGIRRKVLSLVCFLMTRPGFAATRDEAMDALWPNLDPEDALNSLNQTVYFLRRVIEPAYKDDLSPGYVRHESDVIWLDGELVDSQSRRCLSRIRGLSVSPEPAEVAELADLYVGQFALDFAYEEWASGFRSSLHSSYLQVMERAVADDTESGHFKRGIDLARRALDLSPESDQVELSLLRLYRLSGSHAAAAEQYAHYAAAMRENFGIEPPSFESLVG